MYTYLLELHTWRVHKIMKLCPFYLCQFKKGFDKIKIISLITHIFVIIDYFVFLNIAQVVIQVLRFFGTA